MAARAEDSGGRVANTTSVSSSRLSITIASCFLFAAAAAAAMPFRDGPILTYSASHNTLDAKWLNLAG